MKSDLFKYERLCSKWSGLDYLAGRHNHFKKLCLPTLLLPIVYVYFLLNNSIHSLNNLAKAAESFSLATTGVITTTKIVTLMLKREKFLEIMEFFERLYHEEKNPAVKGLLRKTNASLERMERVYLITLLVCAVVYYSKPLLVWFLVSVLDRQYALELPAPARINAHYLSTPYFQWVWIHTIVITYIYAMHLCIVDGLFISFAIHTKANFRNLAKVLVENDFRESEERLVEDLSAYAQRHSRLLESCELIDSLYKPIIFMQFLLTAIQVCGGLYLIVVTSASSEELLKYFFYFLLMLMQLVIYCFGGEVIKAESFSFSTAIHKAHWINLPPKYRRYFILMLLRSQRAYVIRSGFYEPNLESFKMVLEASISHLMILRTLADKGKQQ